VSSDRKQAHGGLSVTTLTIASASSLVAALVVSKVWGGGTLFGAALTPVIVAVVSEGLRKPAHVIGTVRQTRATPVYDPVAEGRRGMAEGDLSRARPARPGEAPERRVHRASGAAGSRSEARDRTPVPRRRLMLAVATGLVAFVVAGFVLTGSELVLGNSVVSSSKRTTFVPAKTKKAEKTKTDTDAKTTTTDTTTTETTPEQQETAPPATTTAPGAQTPQPNSAPAAPPPGQTAPAPSPAPTAPVPAPTTPAPAPAQWARSHTATFGEVQGAASRPASQSGSSSIATRLWLSVSRSRTVTVRSSSDWWSIVTQYGVPISSWRR
jgi:hypothetical protein